LFGCPVCHCVGRQKSMGLRVRRSSKQSNVILRLPVLSAEFYDPQTFPVP
jgi:hypothetical protein